MDGLVSVNLSWGITFLLQIGVGVLGNSSIFLLYSLTLLTRQMLRPIDLILNQLVSANNLVLFSKGIPQKMATFELKSFMDETGCILVFYLHRLVRGGHTQHHLPPQ
jgi:vomeronasal1 receptor